MLSIAENTFFCGRLALSEVMCFSAFATGDISCCAFICFMAIDKASIALNNVNRIFQEDPIRRDIKFVDGDASDIILLYSSAVLRVILREIG